MTRRVDPNERVIPKSIKVFLNGGPLDTHLIGEARKYILAVWAEMDRPTISALARRLGVQRDRMASLIRDLRLFPGKK